MISLQYNKGMLTITADTARSGWRLCEIVEAMEEDGAAWGVPTIQGDGGWPNLAAMFVNDGDVAIEVAVQKREATDGR